MRKFFLTYLICLIISLFTINSYAKSKFSSIVDNTDVAACENKHGSTNSECLEYLSKQTEDNLYSVYQAKLSEISQYDYSQWWMGEERQREEMKESFIQSQKFWLAYRQAYCKSASTGAEGIQGYGMISLSCFINMGLRRMDEIRMVHPDLSDG